MRAELQQAIETWKAQDEFGKRSVSVTDSKIKNGEFKLELEIECQLSLKGMLIPITESGVLYTFSQGEIDAYVNPNGDVYRFCMLAKKLDEDFFVATQNKINALGEQL